MLRFKELARCRQIIRDVAAANCQTEAEVRKQMQVLLDISWSQDDPGMRAKLDARFPDGKPSLEEFILRLSDEVQKEMDE
jgi:hypothetical protein